MISIDRNARIHIMRAIFSAREPAGKKQPIPDRSNDRIQHRGKRYYAEMLIAGLELRPLG